ncbi:arginine repressor [Streptococcus troglodytae]|uniref:Arginine repressor n=1 Tax=Streptococcus troglodytae TaxID=1111760 RepID=A0A1L7LM85_9STRE|nr:arginine repressor [Streptococcus troglodytae]BAQ25276.1 arginine repressor [Streptococcus troglodytae]
MNKKNRQQQIKRIIQTHHIGTQEDIKTQLQKEGISVTQATLSRDLREIGLLKLRDDAGKLYYSLSERNSSYFTPVILSYILKVTRAEFMLVLHTNLGEADVLANLIDETDSSEILGTVAGADTLLVVCKNEEIASQLENDVLLSL